ncbi:MAG: ABC transporter permease [Gemmatimonadota bacterium]
MNELLGLLRKECLHILRDRRTLVVLVMLPIVQVILFGFAIRTDVQDIKLVFVEPSPDAVTQAIRNRFAGNSVFEVVGTARDVPEVDRMMAAGSAQVAVIFESGLAGRLAGGLPGRIQIVADAAEPNSGTSRQSYASAVIEGYARETVVRSGIRIVPQVRVRFNPTAESANLFVPGLMAMVLTITAALMTALSLTREKETGTMETLLVSPLRPWQIIIGKVAPYLVIGLIGLLAVVIEARLIFHVPLVGSFMLLVAEGLLFILVSLSLGILISARTASQRVAMMAALVGTMLPTLMLSGFIFPLESMPTVLQWVSLVVPARWFVAIARGIMLKGTGLTYLWPETLILLGMAIVLLTLSARSFRVRLE